MVSETRHYSLRGRADEDTLVSICCIRDGDGNNTAQTHTHKSGNQGRTENGERQGNQLAARRSIGKRRTKSIFGHYTKPQPTSSTDTESASMPFVSFTINPSSNMLSSFNRQELQCCKGNPLAYGARYAQGRDIERDAT